MAKEFDIYLKRHLTECDLIVYSIPYRDGLSVTNRLILEAALNGYILQKFAAVQMESVLVSHIDDMIKLCLEKLNLGTVLDVSAEMEAHGRLYLNHDPLILDTPAVETLERVMNGVENKLILAVKPLVTQVSYSLGRSNLPLFVDTRVTDTTKYSLLHPISTLIPGAEIAQINQVDHIHADAPVILNTTLQSLCYQLTCDASAAIEIAALVLGTEIRHSLGVWYNSLTLNSRINGTWAQKFIAAQTAAAIVQEAVGDLTKVLYPDDAATVIACPPIHVHMKRYRLLEEIYDLDLEDIGDMTLEELYYVWLT